MKLISLFFLLGLLASALGEKSASPRDVHLDSTIVTVSDSITPDGIEHVFIEIDRIEDDLTDAGSLLAERDIRVALRFDVDQAQQVLVNDVVAPFGYSELSVQAQIYEVSNGEHIPFGEIVAVAVRIHVEQGELVLNSGMTVSTLVVQERVVGIQETEVWQAEVVQQVFVVQQGASAVRFETTKVKVMNGEPMLPPPESMPPNGMPSHDMPPPPEGKPPGHHGEHHGQGGGHHQGGHHQGNHHQGDHHQGGEGRPQEGGEPEIAVDSFPGMGMNGDDSAWHECPVSRKVREFFHHAAMWFHGLSFPLRILVAFAGGIALGLIGILFSKIFCGLCCRKRCSYHAQADYKQNIKVYSLQYAAVPQEEEEKKEKKEKKQQEEESKKEKEENAVQMV